MKVFVYRYLKEEDSGVKEHQRESPWGKNKLDMFEEWEENQWVWGSQQGENGWGGVGSVQQGPHWAEGYVGNETDLAWILL